MTVIIETDIGRDPDDLLALLYLLDQGAEISAIAVTPGEPEQIALLQGLLDWLGLNIPVGSAGRGEGRGVSEFHKEVLRDLMAPVRVGETRPGYEVMLEAFHANPEATLLTLSPLHNTHVFLQRFEGQIRRSVSMGGYLRLSKAQPSAASEYNFSTYPDGALALLCSPKIERKILVPKSLTHRFVYDREVHERLKGKALSKPLHLLVKVMDAYLARHPKGKKVHDVVAAAVALDESVAEVTEVRVFQKGEQWGAVPASGTGIFAVTEARLSIGGVEISPQTT